MQLTVVTATGRRDAVDLPVDQLTAAGLQAAVARRLGLPSSAGLRLVHEGQTLSEDEAVSRLKDGGELGSGSCCKEKCSSRDTSGGVAPAAAY